MSFTVLTEVVDRNGTPVTRRVDERTTRVEILTPLSKEGAAGYRIIIWREWAEYEDDVLVKLTKLPPLHMPFTPNLTPFLSAVSTRLDMYAQQKNIERVWPKHRGVLLTP